MIKKTLCLLLIGIVSVASAQQRVDKMLDAAPDSNVEIANVRGEIEVAGWDKAVVRVRGTLDSRTQNFVFERQGDTIVVKVELKNEDEHSGEGSKLRIDVPQNSRLRVRGVSTDFAISNVAGGVDVKSVSGDLDLSRIEKRMYLKSVSGDIEIADSSGKLELSSQYRRRWNG